MNQLSFTFKNLKPCSTNQVWKKSRRGMYKSEEAVAFEQRVKLILLTKRKEIEKFEESFDIYKSHISSNIKIHVPKSVMFTKKGYISSRNIDLDNIMKNTIDAVFRNFNKLDDKYIRCFSFVESIVSDDNNYNLEINLKKRSNELLYEVNNVVM